MAARSTPDPEAAGLSRSLNDLGVVLGDQGRHDEAVAVLEAGLGPEHGRVWLARANLLAFRTETLAGEERIAAWREHRDGAERLFGPVHRETARATQYLATYLLQNLPGPDGAAARPAEARTLFDRALEVAEATFGPAHPRTADILVGQATAAGMAGDFAASIRSRERAVEIFRTVHGDDHPDIGHSLRAISQAWFRLGNEEAGDRVALEALDQLRRSFGPGHRYTLTQQAGVARRMISTGRAAEAVPLLREAVAGFEALDPPAPSGLAQTRVALAWGLARSGAEAEARRLLEPLRSELDSLPPAVRAQFDQAAAAAGLDPAGGGG